MTINNNFYEVLNLSPNASLEEIKSNFRELAKIHHPDKNNNSNESQILFQIIYNAYSTLTSPEKRKEYDNYLKTSSVIKNHTKQSLKKSTPGTNKKNSTLDYLCSQFNFILWEIEDILKITKSSYDDRSYSGYTINQWLLKILNFIDNWVLEPSGFVDYFYQARKIDNIKSSAFFKNSLKTHNPYVNIDDYFYEIRKRMSKFTDSINMHDVTQTIKGTELKIIDAIIESQMMSYHYLGNINLIIKEKASSINSFVHSNKCYEDETKKLFLNSK